MAKKATKTDEPQPELIEIEPNKKPRRGRGGQRTNEYETVDLVNGSDCPKERCSGKMRLQLVRRIRSQNRVERQIYCPKCLHGRTGNQRFVFHEAIDPTKPVLMPKTESD